MDFRKMWTSTEKNVKMYLWAFVRWAFLGALIGGVGGVLGALFAHAINQVTALRGEHGWILYLLPVGALAVVGLYQLLHVTGINTNHVFKSISVGKPVSVLLAPAIFLGTVITHLVGGSAGREGAALQLGGSVASGIGKLFRLKEGDRHILTMCGMAAFFSALFGTPVGACVFAVEVVSVGYFHSAALYPGIVSSLTAFGVAQWMGIGGERFPVALQPQLELILLWQAVLIAVAAALASMLFCWVMHQGEHLLKKAFPNAYVRAAAGGVMLILLSLLFGSDYNGGGLHVVEHLFVHGEVRPEAFLLKMLFTSITIGCGLKGGEIVPTIFIGATLGGTLAGLIGMDPAFAAAIGVAAMFCGVTNCPMATVFLCFEMFGGNGISLLFFALAALISFLLSGYFSLYSGQEMLFSKLYDQPHPTPTTEQK